jgi:hypothetical protein
MSVFIEGDRSLFVSKGAIDRFKKDVKETKADMIDHSKYLKEGFVFKISSKDNDITAVIVSAEQQQIENKRKMLKDRLHNAQRCRGGEQYKQLESLKRTVPDKLYKTYVNLIKNYGLGANVPSPLDVINNVDMYRNQISTVMGSNKVSDNKSLSNAIKNYFNNLGQFMGIEANNINTNSQPDIITNNFVQNNVETVENIYNDDTEDEDDVPDLVKTE